MTDSIHDKIRNLLAMAEGQANDNESEQALKLAHKLMMKHGIDQDALRPKSERPEVITGNDHEYEHRWQLICAQAAAHLYSVKPLIRTNHLKETFFLFVGRSDNLQAAQDTTAYLMLQIEQLYRAALPKGMTQQQRARFRKEFKYVAANRVWQRCIELVDSAPTSTGTDLVIYNHREQLRAEIEDHLAGKVKAGKAFKDMSLKSDAAIIAGLAAGDQVDLHKAVH